MLEQTVGGRYRMEAELGRDPVIATWRAADSVLKRTVTVKILHAHLADNVPLRERFGQSARAAAGMVHPNVVAVFDTGAHEGVPFIVVEFLGGGSLRERIDKGALAPGDVGRIGAEIASGLAYAHDRGVLHGYVTPENIRFSEKGVAKLGDFGLALASIPSGTSATSGLLSTTAYLAPEQVTGDRSDARVDTYALGAVLFEAATGQPPFKGESEMETATARLQSSPPKPSEVRRRIPKELDEVISRALARDPADRFAHAAQMRDLLARLAEPPTTPRPKRPVKKAPKGRGSQASFFRSEGRWLLQAFLVVLAGAAIVYAVLTISSGRPPGLPSLGGNEGQVVEPTGSGVYDPQGEGEVPRARRVPRAFDGNPTTAWSSQGYETADFSGDKEGVGIWFDFGEAVELQRISVTSVYQGWAGGVRSSDDLENWSSPTPRVEAAKLSQEFDPVGNHRYWMIWFTRLPQTNVNPNFPFSVAVSELEFVRTS